MCVCQSPSWLALSPAKQTIAISYHASYVTIEFEWLMLLHTCVFRSVYLFSISWSMPWSAMHQWGWVQEAGACSLQAHWQKKPVCDYKYKIITKLWWWLIENFEIKIRIEKSWISAYRMGHVFYCRLDLNVVLISNIWKEHVHILLVMEWCSLPWLEAIWETLEH